MKLSRRCSGFNMAILAVILMFYAQRGIQDGRDVTDRCRRKVAGAVLVIKLGPENSLTVMLSAHMIHAETLNIMAQLTAESYTELCWFAAYASGAL